jgi:hypothetical protein
VGRSGTKLPVVSGTGKKKILIVIGEEHISNNYMKVTFDKFLCDLKEAVG